MESQQFTTEFAEWYNSYSFGMSESFNDIFNYHLIDSHKFDSFMLGVPGMGHTDKP